MKIKIKIKINDFYASLINNQLKKIEFLFVFNPFLCPVHRLLQSAFTNYGFAFSEIGVMMGVTGLYSYGFTYGGPVSLIWGWIITAIFSQFISLALGEICSSFPVSLLVRLACTIDA